MPENNTIATTVPAPQKKSMQFSRFFRSFGHDARRDWLFLLSFSSCVLVALFVFAVLTYVRVQEGKVFTFETEPASVPSITVNVNALKQTIELFEQKKVKFNSIRQIGVNASDPSL